MWDGDLILKFWVGRGLALAWNDFNEWKYRYLLQWAENMGYFNVVSMTCLE